MWYIHTMEYHSALTRKDVPPRVTVPMTPEPDAEKQIVPELTCRVGNRLIEAESRVAVARLGEQKTEGCWETWAKSQLCKIRAF